MRIARVLLLMACLCLIGTASANLILRQPVAPGGSGGGGLPGGGGGGGAPSGGNTPPSPPSWSGSTPNITENEPIGSVIGTITASDADNDTLVFSLSDDLSGSFSIDPASGAVTLLAHTGLATPSVSLAVEVSDGTDSTSGAMTIIVNFAEPRFIAVAQRYHFTSPDGVNWTFRGENEAGNTTITGDGRVATLRSGTVLRSSADGITFTDVPVSNQPPNFAAAFAFNPANGRYYFVRDTSRDELYSSPDLITWTDHGELPCPGDDFAVPCQSATRVHDIAFDGSDVLMVGFVSGPQFTDQYGFVMRFNDTDGFTGEMVTPGNEHVTGITRLGADFVVTGQQASGSSGYTYRSDDWSTRRTLPAIPWDASVCSNATHVFVSTNNSRVYRSTDGINWGSGASGGQARRCITMGSTVIGSTGASQGGSGQVRVSTDNGATFSTVNMPTSTDWEAVWSVAVIP